MLATVAALAPKIGKVGVTVGVCHGFVGNRMLAERQREAGKLILEGATPCGGRPRAHRLRHADGAVRDERPRRPRHRLVGRDVEARARIRDILCEEGRRGQKTGAGFYDYDEQRNAKPSAHVEEIIRAFAASKGIAQRTISDEEILERCIYPMINEGAKILEEGKAQRASDIDVVWVYGYGWPVYRGGPMFYADTVGPEDRARQAEGIPGDVRRRFPAGGAARKTRRRGRRVFEGVSALRHAARPRTARLSARGRGVGVRGPAWQAPCLCALRRTPHRASRHLLPQGEKGPRVEVSSFLSKSGAPHA